MALMRRLSGLSVERMEADEGAAVAARVLARGPGQYRVSAPATATAQEEAARMPEVAFANAAGGVRWRGNFFIFAGPRREIASLTRGFSVDHATLWQRIESGAASCTAVLHFADAPPAIATAFVFIPTDMADARVERCVEEEITQSFGLMNDVRGSRLTLFDDDIARGKTRLTETDRLFVRVLYDARIVPGMSGGTLRRAAAEAIVRLRGR